MADRPFVRVYHADLIRDYPDVWDDDASLAAWLRLLVIADGSWPAPAELPRSIKARALSALDSSGLVSVERARRFRIKGMDAERTARADAARSAAAKRWHSGRNANVVPNRAEPSHTEPSPSPPASDNDPWNDAEHDARVWLAQHGCSIRPGNGYDQKLVTAVQAHGVNAVVGMFDRLAEAGMRNGDVKGFLFGAIDALDRKTRPNIGAMEKADAILERATVTHRRTMEQTWKRREERYRNTGEWDEAWGAPPSKEGAGAA